MSAEHGPRIETPRQKLEKFLAGAKPGSPRILAIGDIAALNRVDAELNSYIQFPTSGEYLQAAIKKGQIEETIRNRRLGENAVEYYQAAALSQNIWYAYWGEYKVPAKLDPSDQAFLGGIAPGSPVYNIQRSNIEAADALLGDLFEIILDSNRQSS